MTKSKIKCFWLEPTAEAQISLRRYRGYTKDTGPCPASGLKYHNASTIVVPRIPLPLDKPHGTGLLSHEDYPHDHPSWPKACPCGYAFQESDSWQVNTQRLFVARGTKEAAQYDGKLFIPSEAPLGAMWDADWYETKGPDGRCIVVKTPGGEWIVDYPCRDGKGWQRTGEPPELTARPSIGIGGEPGRGWKYHGFLTDGYLVEC